MSTEKQPKPIDVRRQRVLLYLGDQLTKPELLTSSDISRIKQEMENIKAYLGGKKKPKRKKGVAVTAEKDRWFIDIHRITYSKVRRSDRRKNKGKSRKKLRTVKTVTFVKSVVLQPGMLQNFKEGRAGISPKEHTFRTRKEELFVL